MFPHASHGRPRPTARALRKSAAHAGLCAHAAARPVRADATWRSFALAAIGRGNLTVQGPLDFVMGYSGLILRLPIFLEAADNATWGWAAAATTCLCHPTRLRCPPRLPRPTAARALAACAGLLLATPLTPCP